MRIILLIYTTIYSASLFNVHAMSFNTSSDSLDILCKNVDNAGNCAELIERHQITKYENHVKRLNKDSIEIILLNGNKLILRNGSSQDGDNFYYFRDYLKSIGYLLFRVQLIEGNYYLLVNLKNGKKYHINDLPIVSSDKKWFITCSEDLAANYDPNELQIFRVYNDSLVNIQNVNEATSDGVWINTSTFIFNVNQQSSSPDKNNKIRYKATLINDKWKMTKE